MTATTEIINSTPSAQTPATPTPTPKRKDAPASAPATVNSYAEGRASAVTKPAPDAVVKAPKDSPEGSGGLEVNAAPVGRIGCFKVDNGTFNAEASVSEVIATIGAHTEPAAKAPLDVGHRFIT